MDIKQIVKNVITTVVAKVNDYLENPEGVELPLFHDGRTPKEIIKKRVMRRYNEKCKTVNIDPKLYKSYNFEKLFNLPEWLSFDEWLVIQLRGRHVDDLSVLNLDHIVPISIAETFEELAILFSWRNTRLADPGLNEQKSSHLDAENILLCERLLGRKPPTNWDGLIGQAVETPPPPPPLFVDKRKPPDNSDRFEKLIKAKGRPAEKQSYGKNIKKKR